MESNEETRDPKAEKNDLQVEGWQAPDPNRLKGDTREAWEYESEKAGPSRLLILLTAFVIVVSLLAFVLICQWFLDKIG